MKQPFERLAAAGDRVGLAGVIAAKITCMVGMQLGLLLGFFGATGVALPFLDPVNRVLGPLSLPLFAVSLALMALGTVRRGPVPLALVAGGGLLVYAAWAGRWPGSPLRARSCVTPSPPAATGAPATRR